MNDYRHMTPGAHLDDLIRRQPELDGIRSDIQNAFQILSDTFSAGHKLMIGGNGGSCADAEHITGELMKSFLRVRPLSEDVQTALSAFGEDGKLLSQKLEAGLPVISLCGHPSLSTAFANDNDPAFLFAQEVLNWGTAGDCVLLLSTSGNSQNCVYAAEVAKAKQLRVIAMTGEKTSHLSEIADVTLKAPDTETFLVQEYHLSLYHTLCAMLEAKFF